MSILTILPFLFLISVTAQTQNRTIEQTDVGTQWNPSYSITTDTTYILDELFDNCTVEMSVEETDAAGAIWPSACATVILQSNLQNKFSLPDISKVEVSPSFWSFLFDVKKWTVLVQTQNGPDLKGELHLKCEQIEIANRKDYIGHLCHAPEPKEEKPFIILKNEADDSVLTIQAQD